MRIQELLLENNQTDLVEIFKDFLPFAMRELEIDRLPPIKLRKKILDKTQPTFGKFVNDQNTIYLAIKNRHPLDILRTLAHELVHFKQGVEHELGPTSGQTGSPIENQAHEVAGIMMRNFDKKFRKYFDEKPVIVDEGKVGKFLGNLALGTALGGAAVGGMAIKGAFDAPQSQQQQALPKSQAQGEITRGTADLKDKSAAMSSAMPDPVKLAQIEKQIKLPGQAENIKNFAIKNGITGHELAQLLGQIEKESKSGVHPTELSDMDIYLKQNPDKKVSSKKKERFDHDYFLKKYWKNKDTRHVLGNIKSSDAWDYRGRGLIQLTGRDNYDRAGKALGIDLLNHPELASSPQYQFSIAIWYWKNRVSNKITDFKNTAIVTKHINSHADSNNIQDRHSLYQKYVDLLKLNPLNRDPVGESKAARFSTKQQVIDHFVSQGKSAAQGAAAWEKGWRGVNSRQSREIKPFEPGKYKTHYTEKDD